MSQRALILLPAPRKYCHSCAATGPHAQYRASASIRSGDPRRQNAVTRPSRCIRQSGSAAANLSKLRLVQSSLAESRFAELSLAQLGLAQLGLAYLSPTEHVSTRPTAWRRASSHAVASCPADQTQRHPAKKRPDHHRARAPKDHIADEVGRQRRGIALALRQRKIPSRTGVGQWRAVLDVRRTRSGHHRVQLECRGRGEQAKQDQLERCLPADGARHDDDRGQRSEHGQKVQEHRPRQTAP